jgi:FAD/FMN-containing dehydrogenase
MTRNGRKYRDIDVCVPLSVLYAYIHEVEAIGTMFDIPVVCFGHALDGNLHTMLIVDERFTQAENEKKTRKAVERIYAYAIANGGVISGEHGIGLLQKKFMDMQFSQHHLALMKGLKQLFDPAGILNPEKVFYLP